MEPLVKIDTIIADIAAGKLAILVDDEDRENEGDVLGAAETITKDQIAFMLKEASGLFCLPMEKQLASQAGFSLLPRKHSRSTGCYFTIPVDLSGESISTGVSASDRLKLVKKLLDPNISPDDFETPGHSFPLIAQPRGVLDREGHTEAVVDVVKLAGFTKPVGVTVEIVREDGEMARLPDLIQFSRTFDIHVGTIRELVAYRKAIAQI